MEHQTVFLHKVVQCVYSLSNTTTAKQGEARQSNYKYKLIKLSSESLSCRDRCDPKPLKIHTPAISNLAKSKLSSFNYNYAVAIHNGNAKPVVKKLRLYSISRDDLPVRHAAGYLEHFLFYVF